MKRVMFYKPGDIRVEEADIPKPDAGEVVIKNMVTLTCGTDVKTYKRGYRLDPPFSMGHEAAGIVHAMGPGVEKFRVGDRVVAHNSAPCNKCYYCKKGQHSMCVDLLENQFKNGAYAQYQKIPARIVEQNMFHIPDSMSYKQAALLEPLSCVVYGVSETPIELGDTVCVNGCGPIGLMFIRMCYLRGARVIACDLSEVRLDMARKLGAAETINIGQVEDQARAVRELTEGGRGVDANKTGLHARPAAIFVQRANQFNSAIKIVCNGKEINAKSMIGVLSLGAGRGSRVIIQAEGEDAEAAAAELARVIEEELPEEDKEE
jgi:L-iditol 2-dehydrogenase